MKRSAFPGLAHIHPQAHRLADFGWAEALEKVELIETLAHEEPGDHGVLWALYHQVG